MTDDDKPTYSQMVGSIAAKIDVWAAKLRARSPEAPQQMEPRSIVRDADSALRARERASVAFGGSGLSELAMNATNAKEFERRVYALTGEPVLRDSIGRMMFFGCPVVIDESVEWVSARPLSTPAADA